MAVYTQVNDIEIRVFLRGLNLGEYVSHQGITQGVENTNYHLYTTTGHYILTIFEKRIDPTSLPFVFAYTKHLHDKGLPVPQTLGQGILANKSAAVIEFLPGKDLPRKHINAGHCEQVGTMLARMHLAVKDFSTDRANPVDLNTWKQLLQAVPAVAPTRLASGIMRDYENFNKFGLPRGAVHADVFQDNVFFDEDENLSGVIDFYFSCNETFIYDLAITVNCWCFDTDNELVLPRLGAMIGGYESVRPLSRQERAAWPVMRRAAALRYFATRAYDWVNTPPGSVVQKHDPSEYLAKMEYECPLP